MRPHFTPTPLTACALATALLVSACGGGDASGPPVVSGTSGFAIDDYIKAANVTCDSNSNGVTDTGEATAKTDSTGFFKFAVNCASALVVTGGTNIDTDLPFVGRLMAPAGSTMVTPLTTLLVAGMSSDEINKALGLGLAAGTNVATLDPALKVAGELQNADLFRKTLVVQQILQKIAENMAALANSSDVAAMYSQTASAMAGVLRTSSLIGDGVVNEATVAAVVKAAATRMQASVGINPDSMAEVMAGALTAQAKKIADATDALSITAATKAQQSSNQIQTFVVSHKDALKASPGSATAALKTELLNAITAPTTGCGTTEPTCAPTTVIPGDATTIYSEAAAAGNLDAYPNWGQSTQFAEATIASNKSLKYTNLNYQGMQFDPVNVSTKGKVHFDLWTPDMTEVKISIISEGKENAFTQTLTKGAWNTVDIDLSNYTVPDLTKIFQIKLEATSAGGTLYVDNIYFWGTGSTGGGTGSTGCGTTEPTCAPTTVIPTGVTTIYSETAAAGNLDAYPNWGQSTKFAEATVASNKSLKYTSLNYQGMQFDPVNVATKGKVHFDLWTPNMTSVRISIISEGKESAFTQTLTKGIWNSVDIDLSNYKVPDLTKIFQIKIEALKEEEGGTLYVDNIYFWGTSSTGGGTGSTGCGTTEPTCAPTTVIPGDATTIYSEAAAAGNLDAYPNWGQSTQFAEATIASNKSLKYTNLNYQGMQFDPVNVSTKGKVHFDLWTPDMTEVKISIISEGKENAFTQTLTKGAWNTVDIDLSNYTVPDLTKIFQIKLEATTAGGTLYVDNIYFWGTGSTGGGTGSNGSGNSQADMGSTGPQTLPLATANDQHGFIAIGNGVFAGDYIGKLDANNLHAGWDNASSNGIAKNGNIGYFQGPEFSTATSQVGEQNGWVTGNIDNAGGVPGFFRYALLKKPAQTFANSYMGLYVNAPNNGTVDVSTYGNLRLKLWGPAEMYQNPNLNPTLQVVLTGPKVAGCTATGSGGTEITKELVANQKIGAGSSYTMSLAGWSVKGVCGTDNASTAVNTVLTKLARVVINVPGSSFNFTNAAAGDPSLFPTGVNLGPIAFTK